MKPLEELSRDDRNGCMQLVGAAVDAAFAHRGVKDPRYVVLAFTAGPGDRGDGVECLTNCNRADVVAALRSGAAALEARADEVVVPLADDPPPAAPPAPNSIPN